MVQAHLAVDVDTYELISAEMILVNVGDREVLPTLLNLLRRRISEVSGDGAYDTKECHKVLKQKKIKPLIPSRKNAGLWETVHPRNEAVTVLKAGKLKQYKVDTGYHYRPLSETAMYRYKTLTSGTIPLRCYNVLKLVKSMSM